MPTKTRRHAVGETYLNLIREFPLRPLLNDSDLDAAIGVINALIDRPALDEGEQDYLAVLSRLEENGRSQAELSEETGVPATTLRRF